MSSVLNRDLNEVCDASPDPPRLQSKNQILEANRQTNKPKINKKEASNNKTPKTNNSSTNCNFDSTKKRKTKPDKPSKPNNIPKGHVNICNSMGVIVGNSYNYNIGNAMYCNNNCSTSSDNKNNKTNPKEMPPYVKTMSVSNKTITEVDMLLIKDEISENWKEFAECLNYKPKKISEFSKLYQDSKETVYKILVDWKQYRGEEATISTIISALWASEEYTCAKKLAKTHVPA